MATETLNIKVKEDGGSRRVAKEFKSFTKEILRAGSALAAFKRQIKGLGNAGLTREINRAKSATTDLSRATRRASSGVTRLGAAATKTKGPLRDMASGLSQVRGLLFSLGVLAAARTFLVFSDQFQNMENRIRLVTNTTEEFTAVQMRLQGIAKDTRQSLSATVETYVRLRRATIEAGVSTDRLFGVLTTLNKMLAISGATSQEAEQSMRQLSQAFSKGKLDGDEFRTAGEAMPDILTALQKSLNVTQGELRDMAEAGKLTTEVMLTAFEGVKQKVDKDFGKSIKTFGQAWQLLKDEVLKATGEMNKSTGAIGLIIKSMAFLANNIGLVVFALKAMVTIMLGKLLFAIPALAVAIQTQLIGSLSKLRLVLMSVDTAAGITARSLGLMTVAAVAAFTAGFKLGEFLDNLSEGGISDRLSNIFGTGIDESDKAKTIEDSIARIVAARELEIEVIKKRGTFFTGLNKKEVAELIKQKTATLEVTKAGAARAIALEDLAQAIEGVNKVAGEQLVLAQKTKEVRERNITSLKKLIGTMRPAIKAQVEFAESRKELIRLGLELDLSNQQILGGILELKAAFEDRIAPVEKEIKANDELLEIANKRTEKERESFKILKESIAFIQQKKGLAVAALAEGTDTFVDPKVQAQLERIVSQRTELAKRNKQIQASGKGTLKKDLDALLKSIDPVLRAQQELIKAEGILEKAQRRGLITAEKVAEVRARFAASTFDARKPLIAMATLLVQEREELKLSAQEREKLNLTREVENEIMKATGMTREELNQQVVAGLVGVREEITALEASSTKRAAIIESLIEETKAQEDLAFQIGIINELRGKELSEKDAELAINDLLLAQFKGFEKELGTVLNATAELNKVEKERLRIKDLEAAGLELIKQKVAASNLNMAQEAELRQQLILLIKEQTQALDDKIKKDLEEAAAAAKRAKQAENSIRGLTSGIKDLLSPESINQEQINLVTSAFTGLEDQISSFTTTGKVDFKSMVDSMLSDMTRLIIRMAVAQALSQDIATGGALGGGAIGGVAAVGGLVAAAALLPKLLGSLNFAHGGSFQVGRDTPRFANGGEFQVGGQGGPDTQLVQFLASPGENVRVTAPGQSRLDNRPTPQPTEGDVTVVNIMDPSQFAAVMSSPAGQRLVLNTIAQNPDIIRKFIK